MPRLRQPWNNWGTCTSFSRRALHKMSLGAAKVRNLETGLLCIKNQKLLIKEDLKEEDYANARR